MTEGNFGFFGMPEEIAEAIRQRQEEYVNRKVMSLQDQHHAVRTLLDELTEEQLRTLDMLLLQTTFSHAISPFVRGQIEKMLDIKFGVCPCGADHDEEFGELLRKGEEGHPVIPNAAISHKGRDIEDFSLPMSKEVITLKNNEIVEVDSDRYDTLLKQYNLSVIVNPETQARTFECVCGLVYQSLQDRMLREPGIGGCSGCQQRSAHG